MDLVRTVGGDAGSFVAGQLEARRLFTHCLTKS